MNLFIFHRLPKSKWIHKNKGNSDPTSSIYFVELIGHWMHEWLCLWWWCCCLISLLFLYLASYFPCLIHHPLGLDSLRCHLCMHCQFQWIGNNPNPMLDCVLSLLIILMSFPVGLELEVVAWTRDFLGLPLFPYIIYKYKWQ